MEHQRLMSVRRAMLALLTEGPEYGLWLCEEFQDRTGEVWPPNAGQVHTTLQRLERHGLAGSDGSGTPSAGLTRGRRQVSDA
jgi:DNA-binding PadR family transcriptional regulator